MENRGRSSTARALWPHRTLSLPSGTLLGWGGETEAQTGPRGLIFLNSVATKDTEEKQSTLFLPCPLLYLLKSRGLQKFLWMTPQQAPARALAILPPYCTGLAQLDVIPGLGCCALPFSTDVPSRRKHALPTPDGIKRLFNLPSLLKRKQHFRVTPQTFCS